MSAEAAPGGAATSRVRVTVRAALSIVSHDGKVSAAAAADGEAGAGVGAGSGVGAAGEPWPWPAHPTEVMSAATKRALRLGRISIIGRMLWHQVGVVYTLRSL